VKPGFTQKPIFTAAPRQIPPTKFHVKLETKDFNHAVGQEASVSSKNALYEIIKENYQITSVHSAWRFISYFGQHLAKKGVFFAVVGLNKQRHDVKLSSKLRSFKLRSCVFNQLTASLNYL
jgi:hypothetical protein